MTTEIKRDTVDYRDPTPFDNTKLNSLSDISKAIRHKTYGVDTREALAQQGEALVKLMQETGGNQLAEILAARGAFELLGIRLNSQDRAIEDACNAVENWIKEVTVMPETVKNEAELYELYPEGKKGLFVTADTGHKYSWIESDKKWQDAGNYQSQGIGDYSIKTRMLANESVDFKKIADKNVVNRQSSNRLDLNNLNSGAIKLDGILDSPQWMHTNYYMPVQQGDEITFNRAFETYAIGFDANRKAVKAYRVEGDSPVVATLTVVEGVNYLAMNVGSEYTREAMVTINEPMPVSYESYNPYGNRAILRWLDLAPKSVGPEKLQGVDLISRRSTNRFDSSQAIVGEAATVDGFIKSQNWNRTGYIAVNPGDVLTVSHALETYAVGYNSAKNPVTSFNVKNAHTDVVVRIDDNVAYVVLNVQSTNVNKFMFTINEPMPTNYETYVPYAKARLPWLLTSDDRWAEKNAQMFGDSIVWYDGHPQPDGTTAIGYPTLLKESLGFNEVANLGISGAPIARGKTTDNGSGNCIETKYEPCDLVIIEGGTNDFKLDVKLGAIDKVGAVFDKATTTGALQSAIESIFKSKPDQLITLMTPLQRNKDGYDIYNKNNAGYTLNDYREAILEIGRLYSIPVWDGYAQSGVNMLNLDALTLDGLHLNNVGYRFVTERLTSFLQGV